MEGDRRADTGTDPGSSRGSNAGYVLGLHDRFVADPSSMDTGWWGYFESFPPEEPSPGGGAGHTRRLQALVGDLAKGVEIPVMHMNAYDVSGCPAGAKLALAHRERYHEEFVIGLIGYGARATTRGMPASAPPSRPASSRRPGMARPLRCSSPQHLIETR